MSRSRTFNHKNFSLLKLNAIFDKPIQNTSYNLVDVIETLKEIFHKDDPKMFDKFQNDSGVLSMGFECIVNSVVYYYKFSINDSVLVSESLEANGEFDFGEFIFTRTGDELNVNGETITLEGSHFALNYILNFLNDNHVKAFSNFLNNSIKVFEGDINTSDLETYPVCILKSDNLSNGLEKDNRSCT
jgi:hypothetical protein